MSVPSDVAMTPWIGSAYRHINADSEHDILDFSYAGQFPDNRWNVAGQPTLYFAGDIGVAIAEWGRRFPSAFARNALKPTVRDVYQLRFRLDKVIDVRESGTAEHFGVANTPEAFQSVDVARATANRIRTETRAQAMLVTSIAFLDDLTRWNLVVFLEKMPRSRESWITRVERVGPLAWTPGNSGSG